MSIPWNVFLMLKGLEKGPIITLVLRLLLVLDWGMLTKSNEERLKHFGT